MTSQRKHRAEIRNLHARGGRKIVAVDIENVVGSPRAEAEEYALAWRLITQQAIRVRPGDLVIVASSRFTAKRAAFALAGAPVQWRWRDGQDGADRALVDFIDLDHQARRRSELVIASGDHFFAPLAREARARNMLVHQIIGRGSCSRELWQACHTHAKLRLDSAQSLTLVA